MIDKNGITERITAVQIKAGNYSGLAVTKKGIYLMTSGTGVNAKTHLGVVKIGNEDVKLITMVEGVRNFNLTGNGKKILVRKQSSFLD